MASTIKWSEYADQARERQAALAAGDVPGRHAFDGIVTEKLFDGLTAQGIGTAVGRTGIHESRNLWNPEKEQAYVDSVNKLAATQLTDSERMQVEAGLVSMEDQFTADRMKNLKSEVLTRYTVGLTVQETPLINNLFRTVPAVAGDSFAQLRELVTQYEVLADWGDQYYQIDEDRGDINEIDTSVAKHSERVNMRTSMYGVKIELENFYKRVLPNASFAETLALASIGWAKASAVARESDATYFISQTLSPEVLFDNAAGAPSMLGQLTGVGITGKGNGSFNPDYDGPRMQLALRERLNMNGPYALVLPQNAWPVLNGRKGWTQFLGADGQRLWQTPTVREGVKVPNDKRYGLRVGGVGHDSPALAAGWLMGSGQGRAAQLAQAGPAGPMAFLPTSVPNLLNVFEAPNSLIGPARVILTPHASAKVRHYPAGHSLRDDQVTNEPRPITVTDLMIFDLANPLWMLETVQPTSWTFTDGEWRKTSLVMVEGYGMASGVRGHQAAVIRNAVLDHHYDIAPTYEVSDIQITDKPLGGGLVA